MKCLLLDANVIIDFHKLGYWGTFLARNDVYVPTIVLHEEAQFWQDMEGDKHYFDLEEDVASGRLKVLSASPREQEAIEKRLDKAAIRLDPGELEGLAIAALPSVEDLLFCLFDRAAVVAAGVLGMRDKVISVEEALESCGLKTMLPGHSRARFEELLGKGWALGFQSG